MTNILEQISISIKPKVIKRASMKQVNEEQIEELAENSLPTIIKKLLGIKPDMLDHKPQGLLYGKGFYCTWLILKNSKNNYQFSVNNLVVD